MLYVVLYVSDSSGKIQPIQINPAEHSKEELIRIINSYRNLVRVAVEFIMGNRPFFRYNLTDISNINDIEFFRGYGASTTSYNLKPMSAGFIDKSRGIRVEYMNDGIRVYQVKS